MSQTARKSVVKPPRACSLLSEKSRERFCNLVVFIRLRARWIKKILVQLCTILIDEII